MRTSSAGFGLLEVLMSVSVLAVALLGHLSVSWSANQLATQQRLRSQGLRHAEQFIERLRADDDWPTLLARIDAKLIEAVTPTTSPLAQRLQDGRLCFPVTDYYSSFHDPMGADHFAVLIDVPGTRAMDGAPLELRESAVEPRYSLPSDLNGDGIVDTDVRNFDYIALPIIVYFRYREPGHPEVELEVHTWLRGQR